MIECNFHVGQEVECITKKWTAETYQACKNPPVLGGVYVIRSIYVGCNGSGLLRPALHFVGITSVMVTKRIEFGFAAACFRPLIRTDIAVFEQILLELNGKVDA